MTTGPIDIKDQTEGERFVDQAVKPIPARTTWGDLSVNELIDVKLRMEDYLWANQRNPAMCKALNEGLAIISKMIASRSIS